MKNIKKSQRSLKPFLRFVWDIFLSFWPILVPLVARISVSLKGFLNKKITIQVTWFLILIIVSVCLAFLTFLIRKRRTIFIKKIPTNNTETPKDDAPEITVKARKYILYKNFCWRIAEMSNGTYYVSDTPMCPICKTIQISTEKNQWDGNDYSCLHCDQRFGSINFNKTQRSIYTILKSNGLNFFGKIYKKPPKHTYDKNYSDVSQLPF